MDSCIVCDSRFQISEHIKSGVEISELFSNGRRFSVPGGKLFYKKNTLSYSRIAFPLTKKYGNAVIRNRSKRLSREVYRKNKCDLVKGYDFIMLIYPGCEKYEIREKIIVSLFQKAGFVQAVSN